MPRKVDSSELNFILTSKKKHQGKMAVDWERCYQSGGTTGDTQYSSIITLLGRGNEMPY